MARKGLTAEERMEELQRARVIRQKERMLREVAGPIWRRMVSIVPLHFRRQGELVARLLKSDVDAVIEALSPDAVFALDTAMRLAHGFGFLAGREIQAYITGPEPLDRLAERGMISAEPYQDLMLVRPWAGPPRLLAAVVAELPAWRTTKDGHRVVTAERLGRELIGAVGARADLFALYEKAEGRGPVDRG